MATGRRPAVAKRRRKRRRLPRVVLWVALALLIAGFIVRRTLGPRALDYLTRRPAPMSNSDTIAAPAYPAIPEPSGAAAVANRTGDQPPQSVSDARPAPPADQPALPPRENLSNSDRRALDDVLRRKLNQ
jgi:hypothetical protein